MGCSYSRVTDEKMDRSGSDDVPVPEGWTPIQLGLVRAAQLFPSMYNVHGVRINVLNGRSPIVTGLDLGLGLNESDASHGLQGGFSNYVKTEGWGLQAGFANFVGQGHVDDGYSGLQVAGFLNSGSADGIQLAGYSNGHMLKTSRDDPPIAGDIRGLQIAGVYNIAKSVAGVQVAAAGNGALEGLSGLQVGGINVALLPKPFEGLSGLQVGGINVAGTVAPPAGYASFPGKFEGLQVAAAANIAESLAGVQVAAIFNESSEGFRGLQVGGVNVVNNVYTCSGVQLGAVNATGIASFCVQVGVINMVDGGSGVQFGLWNSNPDGFLPYFPILNFSF